MKILKKNQMAILVLTLMIATAGYFNYTSNYSNEYAVTENKTETNKSVDTLGDATLVSSEVTNNAVETSKTEEIQQTVEIPKQDDYFASSKLEREAMYSQMLDAYQKILESVSISSEQKVIAQQDINKLSTVRNSTMITENLIKNKGFEDCIVFVNNDSISVVVKAEVLEQNQIAQIQNIIEREFEAEINNIHITNR